MVQEIIRKGVDIAKVFVDTVGDPQRYQDKLTRVFENKVAFTVAKKADSIYPVVSAASICAKVTYSIPSLVKWFVASYFASSTLLRGSLR